jgi:hypothetical protein
VSDDRENEPSTARDDGSDVYSVGRASGELLDLIHAAEDEAKVGASGKPPANKVAKAPSDPPPASGVQGSRPAGSEEFVDVGDEAIDAPPSLPPIRAATPGNAFTPGKAFAPAGEPKAVTKSAPPPRASAPPARKAAEIPAPGLPPIAGIVLVFALAAAALALLAR